jgi:hypothetical protein
MHSRQCSVRLSPKWPRYARVERVRQGPTVPTQGTSSPQISAAVAGRAVHSVPEPGRYRDARERGMSPMTCTISLLTRKRT